MSTLYRVGASVSTGKCFPLFRLYKGWFLLGGHVRETPTAVHWWVLKAAQGKRHRQGIEVLEAAHIARA